MYTRLELNVSINQSQSTNQLEISYYFQKNLKSGVFYELVPIMEY